MRVTCCITNLFWQLDKKNSDSDNHKKAEYLMWSSSRWVISRPTAYSMTTHSDICVIYFYLYLCHLCLKRVCRNEGNNGTQWKTIRDKKVMKLYLTLCHYMKKTHIFTLAPLFLSHPFSQFQFFCSAGLCSKLKAHRVVLREVIQTLNSNIWNINEVIMQTQTYLFFP